MTNSGGFFDVPGKLDELKRLEMVMSAPDFWEKKEAAQKTVAELRACREVVDPFNKLVDEFGDFLPHEMNPIL